MKANIGLNYRINDNIELDYGYNISSGTTVLTGTQRYKVTGIPILPISRVMPLTMHI